MSNEIEVLQRAINEYRNATTIKKLSEEVYEQLLGSAYYLLKTSEKYNIPLSNKDEILAMLERNDNMIKDVRKSTYRLIQFPDNQPTVNTRNISTDKEPEPVLRLWYVDGT